jgi:hypothetical protein
MFYTSLFKPHIKFENQEEINSMEFENQSDQQKRIRILVGSPIYNHYATLYGFLYPILYCGMLLSYVIYTPDLIEKSLDWKVYTPILYLTFCIGVLFFYGQYNYKIRLGVKIFGQLFFVGTYQQLLYIYDNLQNFDDLLGAIVEIIDNFCEHFNTKKYWQIFGYVVLGIFIISVILMKNRAVLAPLGALIFKFIVLAYIALMMLLFPIVFYFWHIFIWATYPIIVLVDLRHIYIHWN